MENEAQEYLKKHKITEFLSHATESMVYTRPPRVNSYLIKMLKEMKEVRDSDENGQMPEHPNIKNMNAIALFRMLDPMGHGKVPASSLKEILDVYSLFDNENSQLYQLYVKDEDIYQDDFVARLNHDLKTNSCYWAVAATEE